ncbi:hypothetical protein K501DRAFT_278655 [Backusella circina FSU 941]|nr:hypothetical protein K501DRAFT_278655 [Backusella circina FSU 941]
MSKKPDSNKKYGWLSEHQTHQIKQVRKVIGKTDKKNEGIEIFKSNYIASITSILNSFYLTVYRIEQMRCKRCGQYGHNNAISITCPFNKNYLPPSSSAEIPGQIRSGQPIPVANRHSFQRMSVPRTPSKQASDGRFGAFFSDNQRKDPVCPKCLRPGHVDDTDYRCRFFKFTPSSSR